MNVHAFSPEYALKRAHIRAIFLRCDSVSQIIIIIIIIIIVPQKESNSSLLHAGINAVHAVRCKNMMHPDITRPTLQFTNVQNIVSTKICIILLQIFPYSTNHVQLKNWWALCVQNTVMYTSREFISHAATQATNHKCSVCTEFHCRGYMCQQTSSKPPRNNPISLSLSHEA